MKTPDIEALKCTVEMVDSIAQDAFSRIKSLCAVTLLAMHQHDRPIALEDIAQILRQIEQASDEAENCINSEAESVGCNYEDKEWHRRIAARAAWREAARAGGVPHD